MNMSSRPTFRGKPIDMSNHAFGELRTSNDVCDNAAELTRRFDEDGYLYLPGLLDRNDVLEARLSVLNRLKSQGILDPNYPLNDGVVNRTDINTFIPELAKDNPPVMKILYSGPMIEFYERFLGGPVRHYDYTWCRAKPPGDETATRPHYDVVFMGRGTKRLFTSWTPLGDIPLIMGGLMVLENSHRLDDVKATYGQVDVDIYCTNYPDAAEIESGRKQWQRNDGGAYADDAIATRSELGGRWLTADFAAGDVLIFGMYTMHASLDNHTNRLRLSTDTRYQLAADPVDERWIGENPIGHGVESKQGTIC